MSNNYDKDIITDDYFILRRIWGKNRPHPIAEKFVVHYLHVLVKTLWLVVPVVAFLHFYYFTVHPDYPVATPIVDTFIVGGGFFVLSIIFYIPLFRLFGYRMVSYKELQAGRRNSYDRSRPRSTSYSGFEADTDSGCDMNPASGLPMIDGCGGLDVQGNPYGTDLHD